MKIRTAVIVDPSGQLRGVAEPELHRSAIRTIATVGYGLEALEAVYRLKPDLILIHVASPSVRPLVIIEGIHDALPDSPILAFVDDMHPRLLSNLTLAGASACIDEPPSAQLMASMINAADTFFERRTRGASPVLAEAGQIITILGSKGGVGKTTVATNLAVALAQQSQAAIALVDADPLFGDVALSLDLEVHKTLQDLVDVSGALGTHNIREFMTNKFGLWVVPAHARPGRGPQVKGDQLSEVLDHLRNAFDFVVIDTGGAFTELSATASTRASTKVLITTPERNSVQDAACRVLALCGPKPEPSDGVLLVQNRVGMEGGLSRTEVERTVGLPTSCFIQDDPHVFKSMQTGVPVVELYPRCAASVAIRGLASTLVTGGAALRPESTILKLRPSTRTRQLARAQ